MPLIRRDPPPPPGTPPNGGDDRRRLLEGEPEARWRAARALGDHADGTAALAQALKTEADPRVREAILTSLARLGGPEAVAAVLPLVRSDAADERAAALDALRAMPQAVAPQLRDLLHDPDRDVRILACDLARALPASEAEALLGPLLDADPEVNVCAAAVEVLAEVGSPAVLPALERCAARFPGEAFLGFAIEVAEGRIGRPPPAPRG